MLVVLEDATELRRLQQIRSEFIDNLSHELRTPLSTVSLLAETLARDAESGDVPARMRERIAKIEVETGHLVQMVNELLDLARIEGGGQLALADDVDLGALAEALRRAPAAVRRAQRRHAAWSTRSRACRRSAATRRASARSSSTSSTTRSSSAPTAARSGCACASEGGEVVSAVIDHGIGIAKADQTRIFERFYKADRARAPRRRDRPRPLDRAPRRRGPRRPDLGRVRGGPGLDVLVRDPDRAGRHGGPGPIASGAATDRAGEPAPAARPGA